MSSQQKRSVYRLSCVTLGIGFLAAAVAFSLMPPAQSAFADDETTRGIYIVYDTYMSPVAIYCDHPASLNAFLTALSNICDGCSTGYTVAARYDDCSAEASWLAQATKGANCGSPSYSSTTWDPYTDCTDCGGYSAPDSEGDK
jgi:hypothetical protein